MPNLIKRIRNSDKSNELYRLKIKQRQHSEMIIGNTEASQEIHRQLTQPSSLLVKSNFYSASCT